MTEIKPPETPFSPTRYLLDRLWPFGTWPFYSGAWWKHTRWWAWVSSALLLTVYIWAGLIPRYYLEQIQAPPFEKLQRMEGTLIFKRIHGKNGGYQIGLELPDGRKEFFTCSVGLGTSPDCVLMTRVKELTGKPGVIWWFPLQDDIDHHRRYVMQVEAAGRIEDGYVRGLWFFAKSRDHARVYFYSTTFIFVYLIYVILWKGSKQNG